jgi:hypothetical protein
MVALAGFVYEEILLLWEYGHTRTRCLDEPFGIPSLPLYLSICNRCAAEFCLCIMYLNSALRHDFFTYEMIAAFLLFVLLSLLMTGFATAVLSSIVMDLVEQATGRLVFSVFVVFGFLYFSDSSRE